MPTFEQLLSETKFHPETKDSLRDSYRMYVDFGVVLDTLVSFVKSRGYDLNEIQGPSPTKSRKKKAQGELLVELLDIGEGIILPPEERGTGVWRFVRNGTHVLALRWDRKQQGSGELWVAYNSGGRVSPNSYPTYKWDNVSYRIYSYIWKEVRSPGKYIYHNLPKGTYMGNMSANVVKFAQGE